MKNKRIIISNILTIIILILLYFWNTAQTGWDALGAGILTLMIIIPLMYFIFGIIVESSKTKLKYTYIVTASIFTIVFGYFWDNYFSVGYSAFCFIPVFLGMTVYEIVILIKQKVKKEKVNIDIIPIIISAILIILGILYFLIFEAVLL